MSGGAGAPVGMRPAKDAGRRCDGVGIGVGMTEEAA
jgi:hypothetical protein